MSEHQNKIHYNPIGIIHSPYGQMAPYQADEDDMKGPFLLELFPEYETALSDLECFKYIIILFHIDRASGYNGTNKAHPPSLRGASVGLFASRSPNRPNPIGLDIARLLRIKGRFIETTGLSALDGTPLLDIKPYLEIDSKKNPGRGWRREGKEVENV